jgi:uncharacterized delta-60 repeat protein
LADSFRNRAAVLLASACSSVYAERLEPRRLLASIGIDLHYGGNGEAPAGGSILLTTLPDGKVLTAAQGGESSAYRVTRLNPDGTVDPSFNDALADGSHGSRAVISGGRVIVARERGEDFELCAIRLTDGSADSAYGDGGGIATFTPGPVLPLYTLDEATITSMIATSDGGVLIGVYQQLSRAGGDNPERDVLYKFDAQGNPDASFGDHGGMEPPVVGHRPDDGYPYLTAHPDGGFLVVNEGTISRHHNDGTLDETFGDAGKASLLVLPTHASFPSWEHAVVQADRKILISVTSNPDSGSGGNLGRLNADGSVDTTFGGDGVADVFASSAIYDLAIDSAGRILGFAGPDLFRVTPDGKPDTTFDTDGVVNIYRAGFGAAQIALDEGGGVLVGNNSHVVRLIERGHIALGPDGVLHIDGDDDDDTITALRVGNRIDVSLNVGSRTRAESASFDAADVKSLVIDTGVGDIDHVDVPLDVDVTVTTRGEASFVRTGSGADRISTGPRDDTVLAGAGNDFVTAGHGADSVDAGAGHDTVFGGSRAIVHPGDSDDTLSGGDGDDKIYGEDGDDLIDGNAGNDWLHGGTPYDPLLSDGDDSIFGGPGDDWLRGGSDPNHPTEINVARGGPGNNVIDSPYAPGMTVDGGVLQFRGTDGDDEISIWKSGLPGQHHVWLDGEAVVFDLVVTTVTHVQFDGRGGNDFIRLNPNLWWAATMEGGAGDDSLFGGPAADDLRGGDGNDELEGHGGNDGLDGGSGADLIEGNDGRDRLLGGPGADELFGEGGNDRLNGSEDDDYLEGGAGQDSLHGDAGADVLFGLGGNDQLFSAGDNTKDTVRGGGGVDLANFDELDDVLATEVVI